MSTVTVPASPATAVRRTRSTDIDQHTEQLQDWDLRYDQLDCGAFEGSFTDVRCDAVQLFVERTTRRVRQRGQLAPGSCGFGILADGEGVLHLNGVRAGRDDLLVAREAAALDLCTPAACTLAGVVVDAQALNAAASALGEQPWWPGGPDRLLALTPPAPALSTWRELLLFATRSVCERPELLASADARRLLHDELLTQLIGLLGAARSGERVLRADARKRMVDRACDLLLSQPDAPMSLLEVCREVGASPRKLGYCFQDVLGLSPARFVKATRLNAVRRELAQGVAGGPCSVYDVAARWGFWHFGHFSSDYKRQFGELPSQTLKRAKLH